MSNRIISGNRDQEAKSSWQNSRFPLCKRQFNCVAAKNPPRKTTQCWVALDTQKSTVSQSQTAITRVVKETESLRKMKGRMEAATDATRHPGIKGRHLPCSRETVSHCGEDNHFSIVCKSSKKPKTSEGEKQIKFQSIKHMLHSDSHS